jgi:hypothetical protein
MYDTVNFWYSRTSGETWNTPTCLYCVKEHTNKDTGETSTSGNLKNLKIYIGDYGVSIQGSLCKYYLGDNWQTLWRKDTKFAIEKLSDDLHLNLINAKITRADFGTNIILKNRPSEYYYYLGELPRYIRDTLTAYTLYFRNRTNTLCFYDKTKEQIKAKNDIPTLYINNYVLRYEIRCLSNICKTLKREQVIGETLYNEDFYIAMFKLWKNKYNHIHKVQKENKTLEIMKTIKTKTEFKDFGIISLVKELGEAQIKEKIKTRQNNGELTKKQAFDLREAIRQATDRQSKLLAEYSTDKVSMIEELNNKIEMISKYYR